MNLYFAYLLLQVIESVLMIALIIALIIVILKLNKLLNTTTAKIRGTISIIEGRLNSLLNNLPFSLFKRSDNG